MILLKSKHVKYLGVIIDEDLSWKPHIHNTGQHTNFCHRYYIDFRVYQVHRFQK